MSEKLSAETKTIMTERFGKDSLISLATVEGTIPWVRMVNSYYEDGAFYVITFSTLNKVRQIEKNPAVAICGDMYAFHGIGENLGHILDEKNTEIAAKLRTAFADWYDSEINESNPNFCILCIHLTKGTLFLGGNRYDMDFT